MAEEAADQSGQAVGETGAITEEVARLTEIAKVRLGCFVEFRDMLLEVGSILTAPSAALAAVDMERLKACVGRIEAASTMLRELSGAILTGPGGALAAVAGVARPTTAVEEAARPDPASAR